MKKAIVLLSMLIPSSAMIYSQEKMEIDGAIIIGNSEDIAPLPGTVRFNVNTNDFEGWNGQWMSLTGFSVPTGSGIVTDIDGNQYRTVTIDTQTWMRENLRVTRYSNGDPIPEVLIHNDWAALGTGAWSWYDHDPQKDRPYGKLYNWYAIADTRNVCPAGWHVPNDSEWTSLTNFLGGDGVAGGKMKTKGTDYWVAPNSGATNEGGFTGLPGGNRHNDGIFDVQGFFGLWWSSTESGSDAWYRLLLYDSEAVFRFKDDKRFGYSVRCLKD